MGAGIRLAGAFLIFLSLGTVEAAPTAQLFGKEDIKDQLLHFNADEHDLIGNSAVLPTSIGSQLTLPNGVRVSFGAIVALAGDFYGVPESSIIDREAVGPNVDETNRFLRFLAAYGTLGSGPKEEIQKEVDTLVKMMKEDEKAKASGGKLYSHADWELATIKKVMGILPTAFQGRMSKLAIENYDHFEPQSQQAYITGHTLAVKKAQEAAREKNQVIKKNKLMEAYSMEAFAGHYLTDSFSGGHIRTPRVELHNMVTPSLIGDTLSKFMHDEDCQFGLRVTNRRGDKWIAYGDGYLHMPGNKRNLQLVTEAIQKSVQQVTEAYQDPTKVIEPSDVTDLLPFVDPQARNNFPLFKMENGHLLQRSEITDLQDQKTVSNWWGSTSAALGLVKNGIYSKKNSALPPAKEPSV